MDNGYRYLVLGSGVGESIARHLCTLEDTAYVTLTDEKFSKALAIAQDITRSTGTLCKPFEYHVECDPSFLFDEHDVIVSALPARCNVALTETALMADKHLCELGGVTDVTNKILALPIPAGRESVSVITDCGLMPGLGMMLGRNLIDYLDRTESVEILVGGLPQRPEPPVYYQRVFSLEGLKHLCYDPPEILTRGAVLTVEPFHDYKRMNVPELAGYANDTGEIEAFVTAGAARTPWTFEKLGVHYFWEKTVRWPGFVDFVKDIPPECFEATIGPHINIPVDREHPDLVWLKVTAKGTRCGLGMTASYTLLDRFDETTGLTAMQRTTGFTTAVIAHMMAEGDTRPGINTSECALTAEQFSLFLSDVRMIFPDLTFKSQFLG